MESHPDRRLILNAYKAANKRILFLDYDGTLVPFSDLPEKATLGVDTRRILVNLSSDTKNCIFIISGRQGKFLSDQFYGVNVGLVAEHGAFIKEPGGDWTKTASVVPGWKDTVMNVFHELMFLFPGSFFEEKEFSVAYHYRTLEKVEIGEIRRVIRNKIKPVKHEFPDLELMRGNKVTEVKSLFISKGQAAAALLSKGSVDFILAAGDDLTDEQLFAPVNQVGFTIKIGRSATIAQYRVSRHEQFIELLNELLLVD